MTMEYHPVTMYPLLRKCRNSLRHSITSSTSLGDIGVKVIGLHIQTLKYYPVKLYLFPLLGYRDLASKSIFRRNFTFEVTGSRSNITSGPEHDSAQEDHGGNTCANANFMIIVTEIHSQPDYG